MIAASKRRVGIFSFKEDLHARLVAERIRRLGHHCHHFASNHMANSPSLTWSPDKAEILDLNGDLVEVATLTDVWWRRVKGGQNFAYDVDEQTEALVPVECQFALAGTVLDQFRGRWINDPVAEVRADNKLVQLNKARALGFRIPQTLVSARPDDIRDFVKKIGGEAVVKVVRGIVQSTIAARRVRLDDLTDDMSLEACPAVYQELIEGNKHLRIHVFGSEVAAVQIETDHLDWRPHRDAPMQHVDLPDALTAQCISLTRELGLLMGIIDIKINRDNEPVFLEINPQGQFLFVEAQTGLQLSSLMASFLTT